MNKKENMHSPIRLLLIDDNPDDRALTLRELKKEFEIQVQDIIDAEGFVNALKRGDFDIAITDYQLKWSTGNTGEDKSTLSRLPGHNVHRHGK
jgi:CheY-like chemotaxis protein